jgi:zinc and cadmium transporter
VNSPVAILLFISAFVSGLLVFFMRRNNKKSLKLVLAFSGAYLFAITVLSLLPSLYQKGETQAGLFILIGFFVQIVLEYFSEGIEHGHLHIHPQGQKNFPLVMMLSLCIHAFLEGMPVGDGHHHIEGKQPLIIGIIIHNVPISIALMSVLLESGIQRRTAFILLGLFAAMTPLGMVTSTVIGETLLGGLSRYYDSIMALVIGIFLHISTTILFETSEHHKFNLLKLGTVVLGALVAVLTL